ncbi:YbaK/EbsC family protein [Aurantimonas endophytica]|uniref:Prolyl-tRNA editing enzyme YbaK/EbsC (Cys-tRNA(Pro) deacylase) n=1 Tax=Aurantimonas endophytica TaxID=1522175 RepID=A0A7W6HH47_9HYPH|nr:YbaK/EbsC family protein [Aurantimonas endophytica]MBB4005096.1 prolyl-tRNA editing enzyme YbaK/EbsC (Cys-tRNA(Pro) deacylase) [Aurantimonas endophytica]MCO6406239.1 YbaK/EbsC family protein [Aurantimonas endophytica]
MAEQPDAVKRVAADAEAKGLKISIVETKTSARSAAEAADAVGAQVGQIVKSLVFRGRESGDAYLLLVSGANRVDEAAMAVLLGEALERPDADFVRTATGFAIGGVSPLGGSVRLRTVMDEDLFQYATVWAAAGTPRHVFEVVPLQLRSATGASVGPVT